MSARRPALANVEIDPLTLIAISGSSNEGLGTSWAKLRPWDSESIARCDDCAPGAGLSGVFAGQGASHNTLDHYYDI
ncbi:MAG TPA: hypothetical protein VMT88_11855 [Actinomycetes bacterium]|nr:hypothetical protein [Actinomycetes bacterium]